MPARQPVFKSSERAGAVAVQLAMPAIVQAENVASARSGAVGAISQVPLCMVGDGLQARNQPFHWFLLPVTGKQRPRDGAVAEFAGRGNDPGISQSKRRAKPLWRRAQGIGNGVVAKAQLNADFSAREPEKIRMHLRVIADEVSTRSSFLNEFRTLADVAANHEKCGFCFVTVQQVKQLGSDRR